MAAPIPPDVIDQVRLAADIVSVVARKTKLIKKGRDFWGLCPFHGDSDPSMKVDQGRGTWHCFGCGEGGSVFNFVMKAESLSFPEAVRSLAAQFGVEMPEPELSPEQKKQRQQRIALQQALSLASGFFQRQLETPAGGKARKYLFEQRGLDFEIVDEYALGFAPDSWDSLLNHLKNHGISEKIAIESGLLVAGQKGVYDRFRNRVMFPIRDLGGRVISFGGRTMGNDDAKYINGSETPLFRKSRALYNLDKARNQARQKGRIMLVEGYFDVVTLAAHGVYEVVAPMGTALTSEQIALLARQAVEIILVFDGDSAGKRAATRAVDLFLEASLSPKVLWLPKGEDPDSLVRKQGIDFLEHLLQQAQPLLKAVLDEILQSGDRASPEGRSRLVAQGGDLLAKIKDPVVRQGYLDYLAGKLELNPNLVAARLGQPRGKGGPQARQQLKAGLNNQEIMLELALASPQAAQMLHQAGVLAEIEQADIQPIASAISTILEQGREASCSAVLQELAEQSALCARISNLLEFFNRQQAPDEALIKEHVAAWQGKQAKTEIISINRELAEAIQRGDLQKAADLRKMRKQLANKPVGV